MSDIRSFFKTPIDNVAVLEASEEEDDGLPVGAVVKGKRPIETTPKAEPLPKKKKVTFDPASDAKPRAKPGPKPKDAPVLKLLVVKTEGECAGFCARPEYQHHSKLVVTTHKNYRLRTDDTTTKTIKQRGGIDAEIGEHEMELGYDELLALTGCASMIAEAIVEAKGTQLVVVVYRKKGAHGAYLLGKLAWKFATELNAKLSDATKVGEPGKWHYSELWKTIKTIKDHTKLNKRMGEWYRDTE
jgi:hypothetical protein